MSIYKLGTCYICSLECDKDRYTHIDCAKKRFNELVEISKT